MSAIEKIFKLVKFLFVSPSSYGYIRKIQKSGLFDKSFYRETQPDMHPLYRMFPIQHYVSVGEKINCPPSAKFSPFDYLSLNDDLDQFSVRAFEHYIDFGQYEDRLSKALISADVIHSISAPILRKDDSDAKLADVAVHAHIYYEELWPEFRERLAQLEFEFDLYVTITATGDSPSELIGEIKKIFPTAFVNSMPNIGRDIFPFIHLVNAGLFSPYKAICKIHTKKSPHRQDGDAWRKHLIDGVLPGKGSRRILDSFLNNKDVGILVADGQHFVDEKWWGSNKGRTQELLHRVEVPCDFSKLSFPAGSIYWLKPTVISMIQGMKLTQRDFPEEKGQVDGTLAHAFERALGYLSAAAGLSIEQTSTIQDAHDGSSGHMPPKFVSAFYLPQFHPTAENDAWWGAGFTEWRTTVKAGPNFMNHNQPQLPTDLGYYDLRLPKTLGKQYELAQQAGIDAFCVYHYWFSGQRILEEPINNLLDDTSIPFSFYLCWANESWRRNWDGLTGTVLLDQTYEDGFETALAQDTARYMKDARYQRPDGKRPRFVIYRADDMPDPVQNVSRLREAWRELNVGEVELGAVLFHQKGENEFDPDIFDFWVEMPPHGMVESKDYLFGGPAGNCMSASVVSGFKGLIYDYASLQKNSQSMDYLAKLPKNTIAGIMPSWDNTARRNLNAHIAYGAGPAQFQNWLGTMIENRVPNSYGNEIFINAWNEWAEKAVLEPSDQYGDAYLRVLKDRLY